MMNEEKGLRNFAQTENVNFLRFVSNRVEFFAPTAASQWSLIPSKHLHLNICWRCSRWKIIDSTLVPLASWLGFVSCRRLKLPLPVWRSELNCNRSRSAPDSEELNENVKRFFLPSGTRRDYWGVEKGRDNYGNNMLAPRQIIIAIAEKREILSLCN